MEGRVNAPHRVLQNVSTALILSDQRGRERALISQDMYPDKSVNAVYEIRRTRVLMLAVSITEKY